MSGSVGRHGPRLESFADDAATSVEMARRVEEVATKFYGAEEGRRRRVRMLRTDRRRALGQIVSARNGLELYEASPGFEAEELRRTVEVVLLGAEATLSAVEAELVALDAGIESVDAGPDASE